jgi:hypothetical protein
MDPHYHVPRWVIGPAPGNENGWAFCESDAPTPWENTACWISWDGFEWHTCKNFRFVPKEHELDGLSDEEGFDEEAEMEAYQAEQQRLQDEEEAAIKELAEVEKQRGAAGQVNNQAHKPSPRSSTPKAVTAGGPKAVAAGGPKAVTAGGPKAVAAGGPKAVAAGSQSPAADRDSKGSLRGPSPSSKKAAVKAADEKKEKNGKKSKKEEKPKEEKPKKEEKKKLGSGLFGGKKKKEK